MNSLHVGKKYDNLTDFMNDLENYEKENYVSFTKKDSMTIDRSKVANPKKWIKPELEYNMLYFLCQQGDSYRSGSTTGKRPDQYTSKIGE